MRLWPAFRWMSFMGLIAARFGRGGGESMRRGRLFPLRRMMRLWIWGKSQGIVSLIQFEELPKVGDEMEFNVERLTRARGC